MRCAPFNAARRPRSSRRRSSSEALDDFRRVADEFAAGLMELVAAAEEQLDQHRFAARAGAKHQAPAGQVAWNAQLEEAAAGHSQDMVDNNLFSHVGSGGQTLAVRVDATGYQWTILGENIAAGYDTAASTVAAWMASDGHCANMMNEQFQDIALACIPGTASTNYRNYWTLNFGRAR